MKKMKILARILIAAAISITATSSVFAGDYISTSKKDSSILEIFKGNIKFESKTDYEIKDIKTGSVSTTKVNVNAQQIKNGKGDIDIVTDNSTRYENVEAAALVDIEVNINAPIIYGKKDEVNVNIKNTSENSYENTKAGYVFNGKYEYNNLIYIDLDK